MSGHRHDKGCSCPECQGHAADEKSSIEEVGGTIVGVSGKIYGFNADVTARLEKAIIRTGEYVTEEAGVLLGHIKAAAYQEDGRGVTLSMTSLESGVNRIGTLDPREEVDFAFMAAVLDVDKHELEHAIAHILEDTGIDMLITSGHHSHEHGHGHEHHHHHHGNGGCGCDEHGHDHDDCCQEHARDVRDDETGGHRKERSCRTRGSLFSKFRRRTE